MEKQDVLHHMFSSCGIIHIAKNKITEDEIFEIALNSGAKDCLLIEDFYEIITKKEDFLQSENRA